MRSRISFLPSLESGCFILTLGILMALVVGGEVHAEIHK